MNLLHHLRFRSWSKGAQEIFEIVYGRSPFNSEKTIVANAADQLRAENTTGAFRCIINGYDHQTLKTAFSVRFTNQDITFFKSEDLKLAIDKTDAGVGHHIATGNYEPHLVNFYRDRLKKGMTFVDIGANIGFFSIYAARAVGQKGKVICFEPSSENCRLIMISALKNKLQNITVFPLALGHELGYALFTNHIGSNGGLISKSLDSLFTPNCTVVPLARLDDIIHEPIDMLKMDVEGAEGLVLEGAKRVIESYCPIITSEFSLEMLPRVSGISGAEYLAYFQKKRYTLYRIDRISHHLDEIKDIVKFTDSYGPPARIEDIAFIPE